MDKDLTKQQVFNRITRICATSEKSEAEAKVYLRKWNVPLKEIIPLINELKKENYINDQRLVKTYINEKIFRKSWGRWKVKQHLYQKGISKQLAEQELRKIDQLQYEKVLAKLIQAKNKSSIEDKAKIYRFCLQRGFESDLVLKYLGTSDDSDFFT